MPKKGVLRRMRSRNDKGYGSRYEVPVIGMIVVLFLFMGCTTSMPARPGYFNNSSISGPYDTIGVEPTEPGGSVEGSGGNAGGTETWLATVSVTYKDNDNYEYSLKSDPTSTMKHRFSITDTYTGSFPVVVTRDMTVKDKFDSVPGPDGGYAVSGSYEKQQHDYMTNNEALAHPMAFSTDDSLLQGTIEKTDFQFEITGTQGYVSLDDSGTQITGHDKETFSDPEVPASEDPVSDTGGTLLRCNNYGDDDEFNGGTHNFHREGSTYVFQCQATQIKPYTDDDDNHYTGGSADTIDATLNVVLDPNYVPLGVLHPITPTPTKPTTEPTADLAPLVPAGSG